MKAHLRTILFLAGVASAVFSPRAWAHTNVTAQEAHALIDSMDDLIVVDVRERSEYCDAVGHIPGARNYPWNSGLLQARYEELLMDVPILVVCRSGGRSNAAANFLDSKGFLTVYDMLGGMSAWAWETSACKYSGGSGTADDPYRIATAEDLIILGETPEDYDKHFILTADIDLDPDFPNGRVFDRAVIAPDINDAHYWEFDGISFNGAFDGNNHTISNLTITGVSYLGLFGKLGPGGEIKDLGVTGVNITGFYHAIAGLVGDNDQGSITRSYSTGIVTGYSFVGGLVGYNNYGDISLSYSNCSASGTTSGNQGVGGLVGVSAGSITTSYSTGDVSAQRSVGGLVGRNYESNITNCYSTGMVSGDSDVGGLVGFNTDGNITASFWDMETSGQSTSVLGTGLTTAEMQMGSTFTDAGWDFLGESQNGPNDVWKIWDGYDYPRLAWEPGPNTPLGFVNINDPGFRGQMSRYEVTNAQYCDFLNAALASGDITIDGNDVYGAGGSNSGEDYVGQRYYRCDGSGYTGYGATNGGAARIHYNEGTFSVDEGFGNDPVTYVSWYGAMAFCSYYGYSLPTEDQWQAVADYDGTYIYGCGETIDPAIANYRDSAHPDGTVPVGSYGLYGYGLSDLAGNVWEWTSSGLDGNRVFRGGSMGSIDADCDVSIRGDGIPYANYWDIGFRVCR
jgi:rhodanese-related sulfurtransferase